MIRALVCEAPAMRFYEMYVYSFLTLLVLTLSISVYLLVISILKCSKFCNNNDRISPVPSGTDPIGPELEDPVDPIPESLNAPSDEVHVEMKPLPKPNLVTVTSAFIPVIPRSEVIQIPKPQYPIGATMNIVGDHAYTRGYLIPEINDLNRRIKSVEDYVEGIDLSKKCAVKITCPNCDKDIIYDEIKGGKKS